EVVDEHGVVVRREHRLELPVDGDVVRFTTTFTSPAWDGPRVSHGRLRFIDRDTLATFLSDAGLAIEEQFGDWDRRPPTAASPEIITIARRA
ncbi:MAG TPA: hypothetical protein VMU89_18650, partial [Thermomicrobiaceae bacterium]|nr:hypothetical protein [Thermomicrobiaceae bacterium]